MKSESTNKKLVHADLSYRIYGLCFAVHNAVGRYRNERTYADAVESQLQKCGIPYQRECAIKISFPGEGSRRNIPDFIVDDAVILDLKAKRLVTKDDYFQMKRYLDASGKELGLIVNFRQKYLSPRRVLRPN
jgi:GxxExxY protein